MLLSCVGITINHYKDPVLKQPGLTRRFCVRGSAPAWGDNSRFVENWKAMGYSDEWLDHSGYKAGDFVGGEPGMSSRMLDICEAKWRDFL